MLVQQQRTAKLHNSIHLNAYVGLGVVLFRQKITMTRYKYIQQVLNLDPENGSANGLVGILLLRQRRTEETLAALQSSHAAAQK